MNQPATNPLKIENRLSDCVYMKLHSAPVQSVPAVFPFFTEPTTVEVAQRPDIDLKLTIRFYKQCLQAPGGQIEFGLRRGVLNVMLTNGKIPLEKMALTVPFEFEVEVEEQRERGRQLEGNVALAGGVKVTDADKTATKVKVKRYNVANRGTEECPIWEFSMEPHLSGQLTETLLGIVAVTGEPCQVEATFEVRSQSDIELFDASGLLRAKNLSRNKTAWATREFFLRFIAPKLQPYLSRVEGEL